jgi:ribosomal protein S18 acetylase RimI-like enzyme
VTLRRLSEDDWELLRDTRLASLADSPEAYGSTYEREAAFDESTWRDRARENTWFVAAGDATPVGIVCGYDAPDSPPDQRHLVAMWVAPQARGTGLADRLITAVIDQARADGKAEVWLGVAEGNERARRVYLRFGFEDTGETISLAGPMAGCTALYRLGV